MLPVLHCWLWSGSCWYIRSKSCFSCFGLPVFVLRYALLQPFFLRMHDLIVFLEVFQKNREEFGVKRKTGARKLRYGEWER